MKDNHKMKDNPRTLRKVELDDKKTGQIGIFDCSTDFYKSGMNKVEKASEAYDLFYKTEGFDPSQYFINKTL